MRKKVLNEFDLRRVVKKIISENVANQDVANIFANTDRFYIEKTLDTRNPGGAIQAGSKFANHQTYESLVKADWSPSNNPNVKEPAVAFTASIPGFLGALPIENLPSSIPVKFQLSHGGTGGRSGKAAELVANFDNSELFVESTTLIAGPSKEDPGKLVVWTFHPGDPTPMSQEITMDEVLARFPDAKATVADAKKLGFNFVKRVDNLVEGSMSNRWQLLAGIKR